MSQVQWVAHSASLQDGMLDVVDELFHRFGVLACMQGDEKVMNDQGSIDTDAASGRLVLSAICIRRFVCVFLVFYRHLHVAAVCESPKVSVALFYLMVSMVHIRIIVCTKNTQEALAAHPEGSYNTGVKTHHVLAAMDDFNNLSMQNDLMPAARLLYMHDFPGMYHAVSQVIYFHNPQYERKRPFQKVKVLITMLQLSKLIIECSRLYTIVYTHCVMDI